MDDSNDQGTANPEGDNFITVAMRHMLNGLYGANQGGQNQGAGVASTGGTGGGNARPNPSQSANFNWGSNPYANTSAAQAMQQGYAMGNSFGGSAGAAAAGGNAGAYGQAIKEALTGLHSAYQNYQQNNAFGGIGSNQYQTGNYQNSVGALADNNATANSLNDWANSFSSGSLGSGSSAGSGLSSADIQLSQTQFGD